MIDYDSFSLCHLKDIFFRFSRGSKRVKAESLLANLRSEQNFFKFPANESATATRVSFGILREIAASGKSFTDGEFIKKCMLRAVSLIFPSEIKKCMLRAVSLICPSDIKKFQDVSLSRSTVQRRIEDIAGNITE